MIKRNRRVAIYTRVSTDGQTCANQENELRAVAERKGCTVVKVYTDRGSVALRAGTSGRASTHSARTRCGVSSMLCSRGQLTVLDGLCRTL
jgi:Resolvase, N terminal domain